MTIKMFRTTSYDLRIEEFEVESVSKHRVNYRSKWTTAKGETTFFKRTEALVSESHQWHETREAAHDFLVNRTKEKIDALTQSLAKQNKDLQELLKPKPSEKREPRIPGRMRVSQVGQHQQWHLRCDDRAGYLLSILWAADGDLHISIDADPDHEDYAMNCRRISGSIRLRVPLIGGGMYEFLHPALIDALREERAKEAKIEERARKSEEALKKKV